MSALLQILIGWVMVLMGVLLFIVGLYMISNVAR